MARGPVTAFLLILLNCVVSGAEGQPPLRLKTGPVQASALRTGRQVLSGPAGTREYRIVQFRQMPGQRELDQLSGLGVTVLEYVPDFALLVTAPAGTDWSSLDVAWEGALDPPYKWSPLWEQAQPWGLHAAVAELQQDADPVRARAAALAAGLEILENPDLLPGQVLVRGGLSAIRSLITEPGVLYVYPASPGLVARWPLSACRSHMARLGSGVQVPASALAQSFGDGWDGPGLGPADLKWGIWSWPWGLDPGQVSNAVRAALDTWAGAVRVQFQAASARGETRSLDIDFYSRAHGDGSDFDGRGGVLAHAYFPPPNPESIAGNIHMDYDETWRLGSDIDLYSVALHESGHALGLMHSDNPEDVMYAFYRRVSGLAPGDIAAIRTLYAPTTASPPAEPENPVNTPAEPTPPAPPPLTVTLLAPQSGGGVVTITGPGVLLTGQASPPERVRRIEWSASDGRAGVLPAGVLWSTGYLPLSKGRTTFTIRVYGDGGETASTSIVIER